MTRIITVSTWEGGRLGAGCSLTAPSGLSRLGDHPRGCREQSMAGIDVAGFVGPSPRVRVAGGKRYSSPGVTGTIPAGAGMVPRPTT